MKENRYSRTALWVLKSIVYAKRKPIAPFLRPRVYDLSVLILKRATGWRAPIFLRWSPIFYWFGKLGLNAYLVLRKLQLEDMVRAVIKTDEKQQLVLVGAGFDTLGIRIADAYPQLQVFEIDHPATQVIKTAALREPAVKTPSNFEYLPADLSAITLRDLLANHPGFDWQANTIFVAEGVFIYLQKEDVLGNLATLKHFPKDKAQFIFTYATAAQQTDNRRFRFAFRLFAAFAKFTFEEFKWIISTDNLNHLMTAEGYRVGPHIDRADLFARYFRMKKTAAAHGETITTVYW